MSRTTPAPPAPAPSSGGDSSGENARRAVAGAGLAYFLLLVAGHAWLCDDAFITFRSIENFVAGRGMTWNPGERVQVFTHPAWMLLLSGLRALTGELYWTSLATGTLLSVATFALVVVRFAPTWPLALLAGATLTGSKAFVDFSTSGLEGPLAHLLLALHASVALGDAPAGARILRGALLTSLLTLNRPDLVVLAAPALIAPALELRADSPGPVRAILGRSLAGASPLLAWVCFSLVYFGFPAPNTAYAKLNTGIPPSAMIEQGLHYLLDSFAMDPPTLLAIVAGCVAAIARGDLRARLLAAGAILHVAAVVRVGGDFMSGRFLTPAFLVGTILCLRMAGRLSDRRAAMAGSVVLAASILLPDSPIRRLPNPEAAVRRAAFDARGIADERALYFGDTSPRRIAIHGRAARTRWAEMGREAAAEGGPAVLTMIGMAGYFAGPDLVVIDPLALSDSLLARLPVPDVRPYHDPTIGGPPQSPHARIDRGWRIGHFRRELPEGYWESVVSGENRIRDPRIASLHDDLRLVVRGPIWRRERFAAILRLNLGFPSRRARHALPDLPSSRPGRDRGPGT